jgi:hypothetical protein
MAEGVCPQGHARVSNYFSYRYLILLGVNFRMTDSIVQGFLRPFSEHG